MTLSTSQQEPSFRKAQLCSQIAQALKGNNEQQLFFLEGKLVHRYGLSSLHDCKNSNYDFSLKDDSTQVCLEEQFDSSKPESSNDQLTHSKLMAECVSKESCNASSELEKSSLLIETEYNNIGSDNNEVDLAIEPQDISDNRSITESLEEIVPPPPTPSISHLRRWLSTFEDQIPKAS